MLAGGKEAFITCLRVGGIFAGDGVYVSQKATTECFVRNDPFFFKGLRQEAYLAMPGHLLVGFGWC